ANRALEAEDHGAHYAMQTNALRRRQTSGRKRSTNSGVVHRVSATPDRRQALHSNQRSAGSFSIMRRTRYDMPRFHVSSVLPRRSTDRPSSTFPLAASSMRMLILRMRLLTF